MALAQIRISKTKELSEVLQALREHYRLLSDAELVKLALSHMYELSRKQAEAAWMQSLPLMELSDVEQASLSQGIESPGKQRGKKRGKPMTARK